MMAPHLFCKPIAKRYEDRDALLALALSADKKVMFGSDSAPHPQNAKETCGCAAGVFTAPIALCALAELFESHDSLDNLQAFISDNAQNIYGITPPEKYITLKKEKWQIPDKYVNVVPMSAGKHLQWQIDSIV
jgi:dihydroorotase